MSKKSSIPVIGVLMVLVLVGLGQAAGPLRVHIDTGVPGVNFSLEGVVVGWNNSTGEDVVELEGSSGLFLYLPNGDIIYGPDWDTLVNLTKLRALDPGRYHNGYFTYVNGSKSSSWPARP